MKQMLKSVLMILVVLVCATSLAFAAGDKNKNQERKRKGNDQSYQMNLDGKLLLSGDRLQTRDPDRKRDRDGSCRQDMMTIDGMLLAQTQVPLQKQDRDRAYEESELPYRDRDRLHDGICDGCDGECDGDGPPWLELLELIS